MEIQETDLSPIVMPLIRWFQGNRRRLPWRDDATPYHVWLSEIMLQQTRIEAVIPYYIRFITRYPTVADLAASSEDELMKLWEGLGYYSRARNLHRAAIAVTAAGQEFPHTAKELAALPGIGDYTAGAIASVAFGEPEPAVDGNVLRVTARYTADHRTVTEPAYKKEITERLRAVYPTGDDAGLLTQGLMELGETVCIPNGAPACDVCPLRDTCKGYAEGVAADLPRRGEKKPRKVEYLTVFLFYHRESGRYALIKRPPSGLLASLYEFPNRPEVLSEEDAREYANSLGLSPVSVTPAGNARHLFTHIEWQMAGYKVEVTNKPDGYIWATPEEISSQYAVASAFRYYRKQIFT